MTYATTASSGFRRDTLEKTLPIKASREEIWNALTSVKSWPSPYGSNAAVKTDWKLNGDIIFENQDGNGIKGKILTYRQDEILSIVYLVLIKDGQEDVVSHEAREWSGAREAWQITEHASTCYLILEKDIPAHLVKSMSLKYDDTLLKIKDMAEERTEKIF